MDPISRKNLFVGAPMSEDFFVKHLGRMLTTLIVIGLLAGLIVFCFYWGTFGVGLSSDHHRWAEFGDYVGGVLGAVFGLLAFIALLLTLRVQSCELKMSVIELRNSATALKEQGASLKRQNFENQFFNMLTLHHQIVGGIDLRDAQNSFQVAIGRDCLKIFYGRLKDSFKYALRGDSISYLEGIQKGYEDFYTEHSHEIGHYFRYIYRILKFVDESDVENKKDYSGIVRAQLSNPELALLFYNGIAPRGEKFKKLAERYALFENLEKSFLVNYDKDRNFYEMTAWGEQNNSNASP